MRFPFIRIQKDATYLRLNIFGLKIKFSNRVRVEYADGGPYGMYDLLKQHANVPYCVNTVLAQHGWMPGDGTDDIRIEKGKRLMLNWSRRCRNMWVKKSKVPCLVAGSPFVHYRRDNNITISPEAKGTVAFPAHSVAVARPSFGIDKYCVELAALPPEFHPITVCLYFLDIIKYGLDTHYKKYGFNVVSAGLGSHKDYCKNFYEILRQHKFATSNAPGSYTFYAVEMGIPFFMLGDIPVYDSTKDVVPQDVIETWRCTDMEYGALTYKLFSKTPYNRISKKQHQFVISETGMRDCLSADELNIAMRRVAVETCYIKNPVKRFAAIIKYCLANPLCTFKKLRFEKFLRESTELLQ